MKVGFVGAGNVATHIAKALFDKGHDIAYVTSANGSSAIALSKQFNGRALKSASAFPADLDLIIIATTDSAIENVAGELPKSDAIVAHTSGSTSLHSLISAGHTRCAVIYPFQTFTKDSAIDFSQVPFFLECDSTETYNKIYDVFKEISPYVYEANSEVRRQIHVAGVFSSNFIVYIIELARRILSKADLPLDVVKHLVMTSVEKSFASNTPLEVLTGPARRGDIDIIQEHLQTLNEHEGKEIYKVISESILSEFKNKNVR